MARVRYLGWADREPNRKGNRVVTAGGERLKRSVTGPNGRHYVFRGRAGKKSNWHGVADRETVRAFEEHENFEVDRS